MVLIGFPGPFDKGPGVPQVAWCRFGSCFLDEWANEGTIQQWELTLGLCRGVIMEVVGYLQWGFSKELLGEDVSNSIM